VINVNLKLNVFKVKLILFLHKSTLFPWFSISIKTLSNSILLSRVSWLV
jgi:hypothetical protein